MPTILESLETIARTLNENGVRYVVAGGLAVNAHGYPRATHDVDLVVQLSAPNAATAMRVLGGLGYRPLVPVDIEDFAQAEKRAAWVEEKGLTVFALVSEAHPQAPIDVFVAEPFDFDAERKRALIGEIASGLSIPFVAIDTLIAMKREVGRTRDLDDVEHLETIRDGLDDA